MNLLRSTALAACALLLGGCGLDVMYADWRVDRLCKLDGGPKVFLTDSPPIEFLTTNRQLDLDSLSRATPEQSYYLTWESSQIALGDPEIRRTEVRLYRGRDKALLGTSVAYYRPQRVGVPTPFPKSHWCPEEGELVPLVKAVFALPQQVER